MLLVLAKKGTDQPTSLTHDQALDEALCHGWIDGQVRRRDEATYQQRFTPRKQKSAWSRRNVGLAEQLIANGRMRPAGLAAVEQAEADGRWAAAYAGPATIEVPADLVEALEANPGARSMFDRLSSQNRYAILYRLDRGQAGRHPLAPHRRIRGHARPGRDHPSPVPPARVTVRPAPPTAAGAQPNRSTTRGGRAWRTLFPRLSPSAGSDDRRRR